jgi:hypothetical protein
VSLSKKDGPMEDSKKVIAQSEVESEAESTEEDETKLQEGHNQEAKEVIDSKAQSPYRPPRQRKIRVERPRYTRECFHSL